LETAAAWNAAQAASADARLSLYDAPPSTAPPAPPGHVTLPHLVEEGLVEELVERLRPDR